MAIESPIFISAHSRSGTTMLAGLFIKHGVWVGKSRGTQFPETNSMLGTENIEIKNLFSYYLKQCGHPTVLWLPWKEQRKFREWIKKDILDVVDSDGDWLIKTGGLLHFPEILIDAFPEAKWLLPRRPMEDIIRSMRHHPKMRLRANKAPDVIKESFVRQEYVFHTAEYADMIDPQKVIYDKEYAREVVEFCGIEFDEAIWQEWVNPEMWKRWEKN